MTPWSLKKKGIFLAIIIFIASFFSPLDSSVSLRFAQAETYTTTGYSEGLGGSLEGLNYTNGITGLNRFVCDFLKKDCDLASTIFIKEFGTSIYDELTAYIPPSSFTQAVKSSLKYGEDFTTVNEDSQPGVDVVINTTTSETSSLSGTVATEGYSYVGIKIELKPLLSLPEESPLKNFDEGNLFLFYKLHDDPLNKIQSTPYYWKKTEVAVGDYYTVLYPDMLVASGKKWDFYVVGIYYYNGDDDIVPDGRIPPFSFTVDTPPSTTGIVISDEDASAGGVVSTGTAVGSGDESTYCVKGLINISLAGCFAEFFRSVTYPIASGIVYVAGKFLDIVANFSIGSEAYSEPTFITSGWTLVRDFSNILFIVALVYLAFGVIFDLHNIHVKKSIAAIVIMALMVNFSLFFTKVVIDASNILARIFYSQIEVTGTKDVVLTKSKLAEQNISRGIISAFNPQKMVSLETQIKLQSELSQYDYNRTIMIMYLMGTLMLLVATWVFFVTGLNFVQRTISLWLSMIFAPFAFVSAAFPFGLKGLKKIGWTSWLKDLLCWCFYAPLFFFFIYLIISFAQSGWLDGFASNASTYGIFEFLVFLLFPFVVLITLLMYAKNLAKSLGCDGADALVGAGTKLLAGAAGAGIMVASGGASVIARRTLGASATTRLEKDDLLKKAAAGDKMALQTLAKGDASKGMKARSGYANLSEVAAEKKARLEVEKLQKKSSNSYDFRQSKIGNAMSGALGINMNTGSGAMNWATGGKIGFNTEETAGGYVGEVDRRTKEKQEFIKSLGVDHHEIEKQEDVIKKNKEGDGSSDMSGKAFEEIKDERDVLEAKAARAKNGGPRLTPVELDNLLSLQTEASRRNKEIEKAEREKGKAEKGYTKTYAEFLERNKNYNSDLNTQGQDAVAAYTNPTLGRFTNGFKQGVAGFLAGTVALGPIGGALGTLTGAINGLTDGGFLRSLKNVVRTNWAPEHLDSGNNVLSRLGDPNAVVEDHKKLRNVDQFITDISGAGMTSRIASNLKDSHYHPGQYKDTYKPAMKEFFKFFENLAKGGIEIKGGNDHHSGGAKKDNNDHTGGRTATHH